MDLLEIRDDRQETGGRKEVNEYGMIRIMIKIMIKIMIYKIRDLRRETGGNWGNRLALNLSSWGRSRNGYQYKKL